MAQQKWHDRRKRGERIPAVSLALDTPEYTPGEDYYIDVPDPASDGGGAPAYDPEGEPGTPVGKSIPQLGDEQTAGLTALAGAGIFASLALVLALMRPKKREEEEATE